MNNIGHEETLQLLWGKNTFTFEKRCLMSMNCLHGAWMTAIDTGNREWIDNFSLLHDIAAYIYRHWNFETQQWMD